MKLKNWILSLLLITISCNKDKETITISGIWKLSKIVYGQVPGYFIPDENNTHSYRFNTNSRFERTEIKKGNIIKEEGTYTITDTHSFYENKNAKISKFIELTYDNPELVFFNCGSTETNKQLILLKADNSLENNSALACDGNGYLYSKEE